MELGLHHSRSGRDECTLYFFHLLFTWWWTCDILVMHLWTLMDLWIYLDGLEHLLLYMWYILWWMWYVRMDVWMDEIYMWWMRYICDEWDIYVIYICMNLFVMMECKKNKNCRFGSLCRVLYSAKDPVAECHSHSTWQSWKNGCSENRFSSFAECHDHGTRQRFKKNQTLPSARQRALGKEFFF